MTLAEKLRFLADRAEDGKEFSMSNWQGKDSTMKFNSYDVMIKKIDGKWTYSNIDLNDIDYLEVELKPQWEFTNDEKVILRNLPDEFRWIARDEYDNRLYVYKVKPPKVEEGWGWMGCLGDMKSLKLFDHIFQSIQWSDEEPCEFRKCL